MKTAAEAVKEYIESNPKLAKRVKLCKACDKYYDVKAGHECPKESKQ